MDPGVLSLEVESTPKTTFYPKLIEGWLLLSFAGYPDGSGTTSGGNSTDDGDEAGVLWEASAASSAEGNISWVIFPSKGFLMPGAR